METEKPRRERVDKGGNRAEVRRERKKRDILSPVNVLQNNISKSSIQIYTIFAEKCLYLKKYLPKKRFQHNAVLTDNKLNNNPFLVFCQP